MKFKSKTFTIVLSSVSVLAAIGGGVMLGIGGNVTMPNFDVSKNEITDVGIGLLNFKSGLLNYTSHGEFVQAVRVQYAEIENSIAGYENTLKDEEDTLITLQDALKDAESRPNPDQNAIARLKSQINSAILSINNNKWLINQSKALLTAPSMNDLAIGGIALMSVGIFFSAVSALLAVSVIRANKKNKS